MIFKETGLRGAFILELQKIEDERGFFARGFCQEEFKKRGLDYNITQCNTSYNKNKGTLRGMHYQISPYEEAKLISCMKGSIYDVIIDLRKDSITYCKWISVELSADNYRMLYVPKGFAHGFQTLMDDSIVFYQMTEYYHPESARGISWDDPRFKIKWPINKIIISARDKSHKPFTNYC